MLTEDAVRDVLVTQFGSDRNRVVDQARLGADLDLDSLTLTEVLLTLEDELAISIPDVVQVGLQTFADLVAVVASQVGGGEPAGSGGTSLPAGPGGTSLPAGPGSTSLPAGPGSTSLPAGPGGTVEPGDGGRLSCELASGLRLTP